MRAAHTKHHLRPMHPVLFYTGLVLMTLILAVGLWGRGKGYVHRVKRFFHPAAPRQLAGHPRVDCGKPGDMEENILPETPIAAYLKLPNGKLDPSTVTPKNIRLMRTMDGTVIPATVELSGSGYRIALHPTVPLQGNTNYTFCLTEGVRDLRGATMEPWAIAFTTKPTSEADPLIKFDPARLDSTQGHGYTALRIGPDHQLYAATDDGKIFRYPILPDGTLDSPTLLDGLVKAWGPRIIIGFCFEPRSTADNMAIWITHNEPVFVNTAPLGGAISRMSGPSLDTVQNAVINLPRAYTDHMTNQPAFGPDGALYLPQGCNSAFGDADPTWGNRAERLFSATILRLDVTQLSGGPIDAAALEHNPDYNPYNYNGALSIYATGIRNAYSLIWHSNGHLYVPTNGSSPGGNTPAGGGAPALTHINFSEDDFLFDVHRGKYYGHPNPVQHHYVLHGGNPLDEHAPQRITLYPKGVQPDPDFEPAAYNFGKHVSANGVIEYRGDFFQGHLDHRILVCRYNVGSDIIALTVDADGKVVGAGASVPGLRSLACPLDLVEDRDTGNVYVSEYGAKRIMLGRAVRTGAAGSTVTTTGQATP